MALFLGLGLVASVMLALGWLLMKSRAQYLVPARGRGFLTALRGWLRDRVWLAGLGLQFLGYALYLLALAGAPVSMLAVVMQGGIGIFVLFSVIYLHEQASLAEWTGIAGVVAAMALLAASLDEAAAATGLEARRLVIASILGVGFAVAPYLGSRLRRQGIAAAFASGIFFGLASLYAKAAMDALTDGAALLPNAIAVLHTPWPYLAAAANIAGLVLLQNSCHWSRGIVAMPLSSALSNVVPIAGGMLAFNEHLPDALMPAAARILSFALTIASAALLALGRD